jgi:hypothetical protein
LGKGDEGFEIGRLGDWEIGGGGEGGIRRAGMQEEEVGVRCFLGG